MPVMCEGGLQHNDTAGMKHTFLKPIASAFSRNACLDMLRPYLRIRPVFFLSPVTRQPREPLP